MISEIYKNRIKTLSGIRLNEIEFRATSGRSGKNTLGFYIEEYILNLAELIFDKIKSDIEKDNNKKIIIDKNNKILNNNLNINFQIENKTDLNNIKKIDFSLNILVKIDNGSSTVVIVKYNNINDQFNLESKHSEQDLTDFLNEISIRISNVEKTI